MSETIELRVFHLLCAKLCHDLVSPVGAVSNGVELLQDMGPEDADEILGLIVESSGKAADRLKFFRVAYGLAADSVRSDAEAKEITTGMMSGHGITLDWPLDPAMVRTIDVDCVKLLLNILLLAAEALPRGGTIGVRLADAAGRLRIDVEASGEGAGLSEETLAGLADQADAAGMTPRTVQGFFTARYARSLHSALALEHGENRVHIGCSISSNN
jgi:histidine phosphotransferase ChpT